ncbi:MAG: hypothetical protein ACO3ON_02610 [Ilumatobacteraceae bacterium]
MGGVVLPVTRGTMQMLKQIQNLIDKGLSAYHISQLLKANGKRVSCFGSYYTVGRKVADRVCFYETNNGAKCGLVAESRLLDYGAKLDNEIF